MRAYFDTAASCGSRNHAASVDGELDARQAILPAGRKRRDLRAIGIQVVAVLGARSGCPGPARRRGRRSAPDRSWSRRRRRSKPPCATAPRPRSRGRPGSRTRRSRSRRSAREQRAKSRARSSRLKRPGAPGRTPRASSGTARHPSRPASAVGRPPARPALEQRTPARDVVAAAQAVALPAIHGGARSSHECLRLLLAGLEQPHGERGVGQPSLQALGAAHARAPAALQAKPFRSRTRPEAPAPALRTSGTACPPAGRARSRLPAGRS